MRSSRGNSLRTGVVGRAWAVDPACLSIMEGSDWICQVSAAQQLGSQVDRVAGPQEQSVEDVMP